MSMERAVFVPDLDRLPPSGEPYDRLYLGSEFCVWRLPGERELHEAIAAATGRGMAFSLVTPFLDEPGLTRTLALIRALPEDPATEVVANDLGLIESLRGSGWPGSVVAGRLLTRQRRGPGFQSFGDVPPAAAAALRGSALDSPAFVELLNSAYGVRRFELDDLVQGVSIPVLPAGVSLSLYRPYLLVTATRNCPWIFDGQTWDRGHGCARPCSAQALRLGPVQAAGSSRGGPPSTGGCPAGINPAPTNDCPKAGANYASAMTAGVGEGFKTTNGANVGEGFTPSRDADQPFSAADFGGPQRQDPAAQNGTGPFLAYMDPTLLLGGCAQFLEHRSEAPPPAGVDRIVWQPGIPA